MSLSWIDAVSGERGTGDDPTRVKLLESIAAAAQSVRDRYIGEIMVK